MAKAGTKVHRRPPRSTRTVTVRWQTDRDAADTHFPPPCCRTAYSSSAYS